MTTVRKLRVVVAGQVPPPLHGQAIYIAQTVRMLGVDGALDVVHLPFRFSRDMGDIRRARPGKALAVVAVWARLLELRLRGRIDCLLFPAGGPHVVPLIRDLLLLPVCLLLARRVAIVFHAGGIAEAIPELPRLLAWAVRLVYGMTDGAIVLTRAGTGDATATGIRAVHVVPNGLPDAAPNRLAPRQPGGPRLLYVGHLCPDKGTPVLLAACARLRRAFPDLSLTLVGEPSNPWTPGDIQAAADEHGLGDCVRLPGRLEGDAKWAAFTQADVFVFPSQAPYEGFPLVLLEAMMAHLPIVATRWRGIPEVLGNSPGAVLVAPGDSAALTEALANVLRWQGVWAAMGEANRARYVALFREEAVAATLRNAILAIVERRPPSAPSA